MTKLKEFFSLAPFRPRAQGALALACAASLLVSACAAGDDDDDATISPDGAPEVIDPALLIPVAGPWRGVLEGSPELCPIGNSGGPRLPPQQTLGEFFPLESGSLFVKNNVGVTIYTCSLSTPGIYICDGDEEIFEVEGDSYTVTQSASMEFTGTMAGILTNKATVVCSGTGCAAAEPCVDVLNYTGTPLGEAEALTDLDCTEEATIASERGGAATYIDVVNNTDDTLVRTWINFEGARVEYPPAVEPGETLRQETFAGHAWLFEDSTGCRGIFKASSDLGVVTID